MTARSRQFSKVVNTGSKVLRCITCMQAAIPAPTCLLVLCGLPGAGKTSLCSSIVQAAARHGVHAVHVCFDEVYNDTGQTCKLKQGLA